MAVEEPVSVCVPVCACVCVCARARVCVFTRALKSKRAHQGGASAREAKVDQEELEGSRPQLMCGTVCTVYLRTKTQYVSTHNRTYDAHTACALDGLCTTPDGLYTHSPSSSC